jgi:hypothetical protein
MTKIKKCGRICSLVIAAIAVFLAPAKAIAQGKIVADFPVSPFTGGIVFFDSGPFTPAQTFTPLHGGELLTIYVALAHNGPILPNQVIIDFRETVAGLPSSSVLASASVDGSLLWGVEPSAPLLLGADFTGSGIDLIAGSVYAFSLRIDGPGAAAGAGSGGYDGGSVFTSPDLGATWTPQPLYDMNFQVTIVPEPATVGFLALGALAMWLRGCRFKIKNAGK